MKYSISFLLTLFFVTALATGAWAQKRHMGSQAQAAPQEEPELFVLVNKIEPNTQMVMEKGRKIKVVTKASRKIKGRLTAYTDSTIVLNGQEIPLSEVKSFKTRRSFPQVRSFKFLTLIGWLGVLAGGVVTGLGLLIPVIVSDMWSVWLLVFFASLGIGASLILLGAGMGLIAGLLFFIRLNYHPEKWVLRK